MGPAAEELADEVEDAFVEVAARCHLYVDDAAAAFCGPLEDVEEAFDLLLLTWLVLGAPISWPKVALAPILAETPARWIGVDFSIAKGIAKMRLPPEFVAELLAQLREVLAGWGPS